MTIKDAKQLTIAEMNKMVNEVSPSVDTTSYKKAYNRFCRVNVCFIRDPGMPTNDKLVAAINELVAEFVKIV